MTYRANYSARYRTPSLAEQIEVAVVNEAQTIQNEAANTPDHANRKKWSDWAIKNSSVAVDAFRWPVALNPTIQAALEANPGGDTVQDSDVQAAVATALPKVIADFTLHPPPGQS